MIRVPQVRLVGDNMVEMLNQFVARRRNRSKSEET